MHFGENELSPGSIGFSPLNLPHPPTFQRRWVRTSTVSYHSFILDRFRSPVRVYAKRLIALLRLGFPSAPLYLTSPFNVTRRIILQKGTPSPKWALTACKAHNFRFYFTPLQGFFSPFPHGTMRYRLVRVFSLMRYGPH